MTHMICFKAAHKRFLVSLMLCTLGFSSLIGQAPARAEHSENQQVVAQFDPHKIVGTYYEISRLPNIFQSEDWVGARDVYEIAENGDLKVWYKYFNKNFENEEVSMEAKIWREAKDAPTGKLKYQAFWPFVADYWVIDVDDNYEYLVIGYPDRSMLWIMSREPVMDEQLYKKLVERCAQKGYDVSKLIRVAQKVHAKIN